MDSLMFTTNHLGRISGISRQQLMAWNRDGVLCAQKRLRGHVPEHVYTQEQALGILALGELKRRGVSTWRVRSWAARLPPMISECEYLMFDSSTIRGCRSVPELVKGLTLGAAHVLTVEILMQRLTA